MRNLLTWLLDHPVPPNKPRRCAIEVLVTCKWHYSSLMAMETIDKSVVYLGLHHSVKA
jgi:hypothetical protein